MTRLENNICWNTETKWN